MSVRNFLYRSGVVPIGSSAFDVVSKRTASHNIYDADAISALNIHVLRRCADAECWKSDLYSMTTVQARRITRDHHGSG